MVNGTYLYNLVVLTEKLVKIVAEKQANIKREVNTMGERVLELESDKIMKKGIEEGVAIMIENALHSTKSIAKTFIILKLNEEKVREIAKKEIYLYLIYNKLHY